MGFFLQLNLLLWKNFTLRKRQPIRAAIEFVWPLILFLILVWVKLDNTDLIVNRHECHFDEKAMPSAGILPFFKSLICTSNNTCHKTIIYTDDNTFNTSVLSEFLSQTESLLQVVNDKNLIENLMYDLETLKQLKQILERCNFRIGDFVSDRSAFVDRLSESKLDLSAEALDLILNSPINSTNLLQAFGNMSKLPSDVPDSANELVCDERTLARIFLVPNDRAARKKLTDELCNLTRSQLQSLVNSVYKSVTLESVKKQVITCAKNQVGFFEAITLGVRLTTMYGHYQDVRDLLKQFNETLNLVRSSFDVLRSWLPDGLQNSTSSFRESGELLEWASENICQRKHELSKAFQDEQDYIGKVAEAHRAGEKTVKEDGKKLADNSGYNYDNKTTSFCNDIFFGLEESQNSVVKVLWRQMKPVIRGKIPYMPDTPLVRRIITQANWTFHYMAQFQKFVVDWLDVTPSVEKYMTSDVQVDMLRSILDAAREIIPTDIGIERLNEWLQLKSNDDDDDQFNWQDSLKLVTRVMSTIKNYSECFEFNKFEPFNATEDELVKVGLEYINNQMLWAALIFNISDTTPVAANGLPTHISFKIRMDSDRVDSTKNLKVLDRYWSPGPRSRPLPDMKYIVYGFAYLQDLVEHAIIREQTGRDDVGITVQQFPYPCYIEDRFTLAISRSLPLFMTLAWIFSVAMIVKSIVYEKEQRLKEVMKVMGLGNNVHWVSWFITSSIMMLISVVLLTIVLKGGQVLEHSNGFIMLAFMVIFSVATITQCFMFSVFFSKANLAAACAAIFYFSGYLPYALCVQWEEYMLWWQKALACLSSTVAFGFGCSYIARYEEQGVGMQWNTVRMSSIPEDNFNLFWCVIMMLIDAVVYFLIAWYIEAVYPGKYGIPKPWFFCFTKSYWCGKQQASDDMLPPGSDIELNSNDEAASQNFEAEPQHLRLGVAIKGLHKIYRKGQKLAVDGLNLNFYEGQITSFLGHNGAGKTTTMSILTGLFPPTKGAAFIYGKDIRFEMDSIHKDMGMCPQHNVLFDSLTVEEHLYFYGRLKGMKKEDLKKEIKKMIDDVGLPHKKDVLVSKLSGGMKRKLSVAVAFTAGSRVVLLDEPTAGVDPYARRSIWELLLKYKAGRTIILSTHFMDEADILGDRIAIISQGKLCCCGSSLFLKSLFGNGYYLTFSLSERKRIDSRYRDSSDTEIAVVDVTLDTKDSGLSLVSNHDLIKSKTDVANTSARSEKVLSDIICRHIPRAVLLENLLSEITFQLPDDPDSVAQFDRLFAAIDENLSVAGVTGYGISNTTLEEVFLKVAKLSGLDEGSDETDRQQIEQLTDGGACAHPITRLSFRKAKRRFLGLVCRKKRVRRHVLNVNVLDDEVTRDEGESVPFLSRARFSQDALEDVDAAQPELPRVPDDDDDGKEAGNQSMTETCRNDVLNLCNGAGKFRVTGASLVLRQFSALFIKRFQYVTRSKKAFISQIVLPAIFICLAMIFAKINPPMPDLPAMEIHPWLLAPQKLNDSHLYVFFSDDQKNNEEWQKKLEELLTKKPGLGTRCMDPTVHSIQNYPCETTDTKVLIEDVDPIMNSNDSCSCDTGFQRCAGDAAGPEPQKYLLPSTDYLYNTTDRNITEWLVKTTQDYLLKRYGGLSFGIVNDLLKLNISQIDGLVSNALMTVFKLKSLKNATELFGNTSIPQIIDDLEAILSRLSVKHNAKVWFNNKGYVSVVAYMNVMNNLLLRANLEPGTDLSKFGITTINHPMNRTKSQMAQFTIRASGVDALIAICVIFALSQIPASFILFLIEERQSGSKHLQFVSGVNRTIYWLVNFTWDMCNYMVSATICILLFMAFQQKEYVSAANAPCLVALLFLYGFAITPMMYPVSFIFNVPSTAFVFMGCLNIFIGILSTISTFILELFMEERLDRINAVLKKVFLLLPHFCLGRGLIDMTRNQLISDIFAVFGENLFQNPLRWAIVGKNLCFLFILGIFFFGLTICIEYKFWHHKFSFSKKRRSSMKSGISSGDVIIDDDVDVAAERSRVMSGEADSDVLTIEGLTKIYAKLLSKKEHLAVNNIALGIKKGECFGLLGVNGAGKTTTFKMLTGDLGVTSGSAHIAGHSILTDMASVHQQLGYCPQFDALCSLLTTTEHLEMYARLRGVPEEDVDAVTNWAICRLGLVLHRNKCAADLSGGNKRKLSTAIALVGNPTVIFLDEPTTGMDPKARRFLWNCINGITKDGRSVVLTSHSMEECEALCNRIAIMVNGSFKCLGSVQHLKNRFGDGYTVTLRISNEHPNLAPIKEFISETFPDSLLKEQHHNMLHYQFTSTTRSLSTIFGKLESVRQQFNIEDYSVSQTTLDQVFINFAKMQTDLVDDERLALTADSNNATAEETRA